MVDRILPYPPRKDQLNRAKIGHSPARKLGQPSELSPLSLETSPSPTLKPMVITTGECLLNQTGKELIIPENINTAATETLGRSIEMVRLISQGYAFLGNWDPKPNHKPHFSNSKVKHDYANIRLDLNPKTLNQQLSFLPNIKLFMERNKRIGPRMLMQTTLSFLIPPSITRLGDNWTLSHEFNLLNKYPSFTAIIHNLSPDQTIIASCSNSAHEFTDLNVHERTTNTAMSIISMPTHVFESQKPTIASDPSAFLYTLFNTAFANHPGEIEVQAGTNKPPTNLKPYLHTDSIICRSKEPRKQLVTTYDAQGDGQFIELQTKIVNAPSLISSR